MSTSVTAEPSDAIVFVGGSSDLDQTTPAQLADSLARELDRRAPDLQARFVVRPLSVDGTVVHRIERNDAQGTTALADFYHVVPSDGDTKALAGPKEVISLALQVLAGIIVLWRVFAGSNRHAKSSAQKAQLGYCVLMLLALVAYFVIAVVALIQALLTAVAGAGSEIDWPQWTVLVGAVLGVLWPNARSRLTAVAEAHRLMMRYLWTASRRNVLTTQVRDLVDDINRRENIKNVHLVGYSFGSLVVLDTVFPANSTASELRQVRTIATIGCPFDLVRMLIPSYPSGRDTGTAEDPHWVNVYAPADLLASNFADGDDVTNQATTGVAMTDGSIRQPDGNVAWNSQTTPDIVSLLVLRSLSVHNEYWPSDVPASSAFDAVLPQLFANEVPA